MKYTVHDIETDITHYNDQGLMIMYGDVPVDHAHILFLSHQELVQALYNIGYATDYDVELVCIPMPTDSPDNGVYNWMTLDEFILNNTDSNGNLDWQIATDLVLHCINSKTHKTSLP